MPVSYPRIEHSEQYQHLLPAFARFLSFVSTTTFKVQLPAVLLVARLSKFI
jgi:uncharacterized membrane protein (DUF485 family)